MNSTICIAGKNNIAIEIMDHLFKNYSHYSLVAITNKNDDGNNLFQLSFKSYCINKKIPLVKLEDLYKIENLIFLSLEFDRIIKPEKFLSKQLYNIHFSYLPSYKGMYTSALPILNNEKYSGVTLHKIDFGIDTGDIIDQIKFEIGFKTTGQELYLKYIKYGSALVKQNIRKLLSNDFECSSQSTSNASYFGKSSIDYSNIVIDINKTALEIYNQIRAFSFPAYQLPQVFGFSMYHAIIQHEKSNLRPGKIIDENEFQIIISTIDYNLAFLKDRRNELFEASRKEDLYFLQYLYDNNYPLNQRSKEGWDALIISAYYGNLDMIKWLIEEHQWNVNTYNNNLTSFIMYVMTEASLNNNIKVLQYIIDEDIKVNWRHVDAHGKSIGYYAKKLGNKNVLDIISCKLNF